MNEYKWKVGVLGRYFKKEILWAKNLGVGGAKK